MVLRWKAWNIGLAAFGVALIIFSIIWVFAIVAPMVKLPADYDVTVNFEGTISTLNPQTQLLGEIPVKIERVQRATGTEDNVLLIEEKVTTTHGLAGVPVPDFGETNLLGVDRSPREHVSGKGDMERQGQFAFPDGVKKETYPVWYATAGKALNAKFVAEEEFQGLNVYVFKIAAQDCELGTQPGTGIPLFLDAEVDIKVEPVSGTTVYTSIFWAFPEMRAISSKSAWQAQEAHFASLCKNLKKKTILFSKRS